MAASHLPEFEMTQLPVFLSLPVGVHILAKRPNPMLFPVCVERKFVWTCNIDSSLTRQSDIIVGGVTPKHFSSDLCKCHELPIKKWGPDLLQPATVNINSAIDAEHGLTKRIFELGLIRFKPLL